MFEPRAPACTRGAPSRAHTLPHFLEGAFSLAEKGAVKKRGASGTPRSQCLFEPGRPYNFNRSYYVATMRTRTGSYAKSPRIPPVRQTSNEKVVRVLTSKGPSTVTAHKPPNRAKGARRIHPSEMLRFPVKKKQASGEGAGMWGLQPPPLGRLFR